MAKSQRPRVRQGTGAMGPSGLKLWGLWTHPSAIGLCACDEEDRARLGWRLDHHWANGRACSLMGNRGQGARDWEQEEWQAVFRQLNVAASWAGVRGLRKINNCPGHIACTLRKIPSTTQGCSQPPPPPTQTNPFFQQMVESEGKQEL